MAINEVHDGAAPGQAQPPVAPIAAGQAVAPGRGHSGGLIQSQLNSLIFAVGQANNALTSLKENVLSDHTACMNQFTTVHRNINHINRHPVRALEREAERNSAAAGSPARRAFAGPLARAELPSCPRTIHGPWLGCTQGLGGRKPAKGSAPRERGKNRGKCARRLAAWKRMRLLANAGCTAEVACGRIRGACGHGKTATQIIAAAGRGQRGSNWHSSLRVMGET